MYGKTLSIPDAAMPSWYDLLLGEAPPEGASPRDAKRALARALVTRFHGDGGRRGGRGALRPRARRARGARGHRRGRLRAGDGDGPPARELLADALRAARAPRRGGMLAQGGVRLDGEPVAELDLPPSELDGRSCRSASAASCGCDGRWRSTPRCCGCRPRARARSSTSPRAVRARARRGGRGRRRDRVRDRLDGRDHDDGVRAGRGPGPPGGARAAGPRARPGAATTRTTAQPRRQRARAPARVAARPVASIPLVRGSLVLGTWQQVVLIDFDDRPRERVGPRPDHVLRLLHSPPAAEVATPSALGGPRGALYSAARSGSRGLPGKP